MSAKQRAESREGMVVTTVAFPKELHKRLAIAAIEDEMAITEIVRRATQEYLVRRGKRPRRKTKR